jgi:uncharacterized damage-inducible protein DinB
LLILIGFVCILIAHFSINHFAVVSAAPSAINPNCMMSVIDLLLKELEEEIVLTRKMLQRIPDDKWDWKPHEKSMSMKSLVVHLAELPSWVSMGLHTSELDFAAMDYKPTEVTTPADVLTLFEGSVTTAREALKGASEDDLLPTWTMRSGDHVHAVMTKYEVIRHSFSQSIHHRAQLGVYLRLLDIPIPGTYGPSADEMSF